MSAAATGLNSNSGRDAAMQVRPIGVLTQNMGGLHQQLNALEAVANRLFDSQIRLVRPEPSSAEASGTPPVPISDNIEAQLDNALHRGRALLQKLEAIAEKFEAAL